ncbi:hypothetical protein HanIR_Chr13g0660431 [Helianthus annuus]|nr:hypothetical protein HanIR_Chr13g0660431 [Helianthus annuus]
MGVGGGGGGGVEVGGGGGGAGGVGGGRGGGVGWREKMRRGRRGLKTWVDVCVGKRWGRCFK